MPSFEAAKAVHSLTRSRAPAPGSPTVRPREPPRRAGVSAYLLLFAGVGVALTVWGVAVGFTGVAVGLAGCGVAVGLTGVGVGFTGVAVGLAGCGVGVGFTGVAVGLAACG